VPDTLEEGKKFWEGGDGDWGLGVQGAELGGIDL
jgi:hypothetical protein